MNDPRIVLDPKTVRFRNAVDRVRKYDGSAAIGMATNTEIARLEKLADQFEERAKVEWLDAATSQPQDGHGLQGVRYRANEFDADAQGRNSRMKASSR
jgi:hypothetical protein